MSGVSPRHLRPPRLAEVIAQELRDRILSGELPDGALLPKQEDLIEEFGVSLPSIRESLRVLETEGLVVVQRGNVGGAVVHHPGPAKAAYMLALVLQARGVPLGDVMTAIRAIEPVCAAACADRTDRAEALLPGLRATLDDAASVVGEGMRYAALARRFHHELVAHCGNETMILVVGALESLWSVHVSHLARRTNLGAYEDEGRRRRTLDEHEAIYHAIERGDARAAHRAVARHLAGPEEGDAAQPVRYAFDFATLVDAALARDGVAGEVVPVRPGGLDASGPIL
jgi:DNA-binding FadR family transcriptional regulator